MAVFARFRGRFRFRFRELSSAESSLVPSRSGDFRAEIQFFFHRRPTAGNETS